MIEIKLYGRGGQGVVTGAELIAAAAFYDGKYSQAFPFFGVERRGAPIEAYARINDSFINLREQIKEPDIIIIQDSTLLNSNKNLLNGLRNNGVVLINTSQDLSYLFKEIGKVDEAKDKGYILMLFDEKKKKFKLIKVDGTSIALKILGKPIVNTLIVFALAEATKIITAASVEKALKEKFSGEILQKNLLLKDAIHS